MISFIVLQ